MSKKLVIDVPEDLRTRFKALCIKNHVTMRNEITGFMRRFVEGTEEEKKKEAAPLEEKVGEKGEPLLPPFLSEEGETASRKTEIINDVDFPFNMTEGKPSLKNPDDCPFSDVGMVKDDTISQKVANELKPICEKLESQQTISQSEIESLVSWKGDVCKWLNDWRAEVDRKFVMIANFLENHIKILEETTSAEKCEDDIKGLKLLRGEPS